MKNQNRRSRLLASKRKQKLKHGISWRQYGSIKDNEAHKHKSDNSKYWKVYYLSGSRGLAKRCTSRRLRMLYRRGMLNREDVCAMRNGDYTKVFDYDWWVW